MAAFLKLDLSPSSCEDSYFRERMSSSPEEGNRFLPNLSKILLPVSLF
jgi:hypothetical protein